MRIVFSRISQANRAVWFFKMWDSEGVNNEGGFNTSMTPGASPTLRTEAKQNTVIHSAISELLINPEENKNTHVVVVGIIKEVRKFLNVQLLLICIIFNKVYVTIVSRLMCNR